MHREKWYEKSLGKVVLMTEKVILDRLLKNTRRNDLLQIGGPSDDRLIKNLRVTRSFFLDSRHSQDHYSTFVQADSDCLPIRSESMDIVLLIHALEFSDHPVVVLQEAYRVLKPNGRMIIFGVNRWSLWRLWSIPVKKLFSAQIVKNKLRGMGCDIELHQTLCFYPQIPFVEVIGQFLFPYGGAIYAIYATKNVYGVTPMTEQYVNARMKGSHSGNRLPVTSYQITEHDR